MKNLLLLSVSFLLLLSCNNNSSDKVQTADTLQQLLTGLKDSIVKNPGNPSFTLQITDVLERSGRAGEAIKFIDSIINTPDSKIPPRMLIELVSRKAYLYELTNDTLNAIKTLEQIVRPGEITDAGLRLGYLYAETGNRNTIALCDAMIQNDETGIEPVPDYLKGIYYYNTGNTRAAIDQFDKSISKDYTFIDAYMEKGRVLFNQNAFKKGIEVYDMALKVSPGFSDAFYWKAKCQEKLGLKEDARQNYQRAYALDRTLTEALEALENL